MNSSPAPIKYRYDINGLRAWAVIAVLLFHFGIPGASAGFIGVDIFFVISGYLMTIIVVKAMEDGSFSVWRFYLARIRRIVPALMALVAVLLALGWFWLPTPEYQDLGSESLSALTFTSNLLFWRSAGYFDVAAHQKWLLHTWSLGIEFQFYIIFPIYVILLWKIRPKTSTITWGLVFALLVSLALSVGYSSLKPGASFYLLPMRGWELAVGGLTFLIARNNKSLSRFSTSIFWAGIVLWVIGFVVIDGTLAWPSAWALFPVLGTALIILAQKTDMPLMHNPVAQWIGDCSYSLYLWHWPLVVALYYAGLQNDWAWIIGAFGLSLLLGHLSYHWIENPTRKYFTKSSFFKQAGVLGLAFVITGISAAGTRSFFFEGRISESVEIAAAERTNYDLRRAECFESATGEGSPGCVYGDPENFGAILMGDSHAASVVTSLGVAAEKYEAGVIFWGMNSCPTMDGVTYTDITDRPKHICKNLNEWAFERLSKYQNVPLILVSRTSSYLMGPNEPDRSEKAPYPSIYFDNEYEYRDEPGFAKEFLNSLVLTACRLSSDRDVYLMRPVPEFGVSVPWSLINQANFNGESAEIKIKREVYEQRNKLVWDAQDRAAEECGVKILNPLPQLCDDEYCYGSNDGRPLYYDDDHLSEYGNKFLVPMFEEVFSDLGSIE
jgi:peptidoglycan/LPS O-acetylase OafA/YrhL